MVYKQTRLHVVGNFHSSKPRMLAQVRALGCPTFGPTFGHDGRAEQDEGVVRHAHAPKGRGAERPV